MMPRQYGKSTSTIAFLLHYIIFNENVRVALLANKGPTANVLLGRLQLAYENLPEWLQIGVLAWNKGSLELENGSTVLASATSSSAVRGDSFNVIVLDEFAHVENNLAADFFASVYPTISSGMNTKVIITSTPKGMNHFYKRWIDAEGGRNDYVAVKVHWSERPGRDEKWKETTIRNTSAEHFAVEFECSFLGSTNTLISGQCLSTIPYLDPKVSNAGLCVHEEPIAGHEYFITVDVARGSGNDYSAFVVFDLTEYPHRVVAKYKNNDISALMFPEVIKQVATKYNDAWVLAEVNDIGEQVANILYLDLEYPQVLMTAVKGRSGQVLAGGFSGRNGQMGVKMSNTAKKIGCANLKTVIEDQKLWFCDGDILEEMTVFIEKNGTYKADTGYNDDLAMCLVIYAWAITQPYMKDLMELDMRKKIHEDHAQQIEEDMLPFKFFTASELEDDDEEKDESLVWTPTASDWSLTPRATALSTDELRELACGQFSGYGEWDSW